jgi:tetratricopeptide (TPR) repeat protein
MEQPSGKWDHARATPEEAFNRALRRAKSDSRTWLTIKAGLAAVGAVKAYLAQRRPRALSDRRLDRLHRMVAEVSIAGMRRALVKLLETLSTNSNRTRVLDATANFAESLHRAGRFELAAVVHRYVLEEATDCEEFDFASAHFRLGYCLRELGDLKAADHQYGLGLTWATEHDDARAILRLDLALANLARVRGNPEEARMWADSALSGAMILRDPELITKAAQVRGNLAYDRAEWIQAVQFHARALRTVTAWYEIDRQAALEGRCRLLNDIGLGLHRLGLHGEARNAWMTAHLMTTERMTRWTASINLMALAALDGLPDSFEHHREFLENARLPARVGVVYLEELADAYMELNRLNEARDTYRRLAHLAAQHGFVPFAHYAWQGLSGTLIRVRPIRSTQVPTEIAALVDEVRRLSTLPSLLARGISPSGLVKRLRRGRRRR